MWVDSAGAKWMIDAVLGAQSVIFVFHCPPVGPLVRNRERYGNTDIKQKYLYIVYFEQKNPDQKIDQGKFKQRGFTPGRRNDRHTNDKYLNLELERGSDITK